MPDPGTGTFGVFKLGPSGNLVTLPELNEFHVDPVTQGSVHVLLNGKARADEFGRRKHFYLGWEGLTDNELATIESAWETDGAMTFQTHDADYTVCRANHAPIIYDNTGWISTSIELEEV